MPKRDRRVPPPTGTGDEPAATATEDHSPEVGGWPSSRPIIIGDPTLEFEPRAIGYEYQRAPYRPDTVIDGWSHGGFTIRAASMRGHLHRFNGAPRQDDLAIAIPDQRERLIVAVADGVSAAGQSHIGSTTAVRYASQWLVTEDAGNLGDIAWRSLFESTAWKLNEVAVTTLSMPEVDAARAELALATTLTCAVCEPNNDATLSVVIAGVGDSGAWLLSGGNFARVWGGKEASEAGLTSSAVSGLPQVPHTVEPAELIVWPGDVLLIGTDGFGDPLGGGTGSVGGLFRDAFTGRIPSPLEFAHLLDFSRETFDDDRTLVAVWPSRGGSEQPWHSSD
ncbi:protein phosphatase 2C domain-containing protein [Nocardia sp. NPDC059240]|uniref:protein phosphatase 2C domain-containing protein n=1 Tax=Nocardia sp. NPDC059240 TaxID=3346786 RepID=UPI0036C396C7